MGDLEWPGEPDSWDVGSGKDWTDSGDIKLLRTSYASWANLSMRERFPYPGKRDIETSLPPDDDYHYSCENCKRICRGPKIAKPMWWDLSHKRALATEAGYEVCTTHCWKLLLLARTNYFKHYARLPGDPGNWWWHMLWWVIQHQVNPRTERGWLSDTIDKIPGSSTPTANRDLPWTTGKPKNYGLFAKPIPIPNQHQEDTAS